MRLSLRSWLWRVPVGQEVDEELAFHLEMRTRDLVEGGMDPETARDTAIRRIGDIRRLKRTCVGIGKRRDGQMRLARWLHEFRDDVTFSIRQLKASPGFTAVAAITLALGIGANSAIFALADATVLRPLPFADAERVVLVREFLDDQTRPVNPLDFVDWRDRNRTFAAIAGVLEAGRALTGTDGTAEPIPSQAVTAQFFDVLGVTPVTGRTFAAADQTSAPDVVVLSEGFWRSQFAGDPAIVGRTVRLDGQPFTVIGIVPADLRLDAVAAGANRPRLWTLLDLPRDRSPAQRYAHYLTVIGRLAPGATLEAAHTDLNTIASAIARESPATNEGHGVILEPLHARIIGPELRLTSLLLLGVVGFVLLMCCANIGNLVLARTTARARELAVRSALGAGRRRIVRQLFTESLVLGALGGVLGVAVGAFLLSLAPSVIPPGLLPHAVTLEFDGRVLAFCVGAALLVAIAFGVAPAWHATGRSVTQAISLDSRSATGRGAWLRSLLAAGQVAAAVLLLCGAGLLLRTLVALERVDPGHRARNVLTMVVSPGMSGTPDSWRQFYDAIAREVEGLPGVRHVAFGSSLPLDGSWYGQAFEVEGDLPRPQADRDGAGYQMVSASYFRTLGIPMVAGREFGDGDTADGPQVCIVDEAFVRRYLAGRDPLRTRLVVQAMTQPSQAFTREIVGVVRDVPEQPGEAEAQPHIYVPLAQNSWWSASLVVQASDGPAEALVPGIRAAVARVDPDRPVTNVRTMEEIASAATVRPRFRMALVGGFALLALGLAMVGVFGVLAYAVQQRTRELGVRMALGATAADVFRLVVTSAARITIAGAAVGLTAAALVSRWISTLLFGVEPADPVTFASVVAVLTVTAALATAAPALRAVRVDPAVTFRNE